MPRSSKARAAWFYPRVARGRHFSAECLVANCRTIQDEGKIAANERAKNLLGKKCRRFFPESQRSRDSVRPTRGCAPIAADIVCAGWLGKVRRPGLQHHASPPALRPTTPSRTTALSLTSPPLVRVTRTGTDLYEGVRLSRSTCSSANNGCVSG
jgi:hypothetical protein